MYQLLSYPLTEETPLYGDTPKVSFTPLKEMAKGHSCNTALVSFCNHSGTHIDAPLHFSKEGLSVTDFNIENYIFTKPFILHCPKSSAQMVTDQDVIPFQKQIENCDALLIKTGFSAHRENDTYRTHNPGISPSLAKYLMETFSNLKLVGIDCISVSSFQNREAGRETHRLFLDNNKRPMILLEDLNLEAVDIIETLYVIPLLLKGLDGAPATVFAKIN
jgi:arylformamidase